MNMKTAKTIILLLGIFTFSSFSAFSQDFDVEGEDLYKTPDVNLTHTFEGRLPGVTVISNDATPGSQAARMFIRGIGSYAQGLDVNTLKFYVDGFEVKSDFITYMSPEEIETVSVLKDAVDLATFGMNGANGVIWITTKRGSQSAPQVNFQLRSGVQMPVNVAKPLRSLDYASLYNQAWSNDHGREWDPYYDAIDMAAYRNGEGVDTDWYDKVYRNCGMLTDGVLSYRGGTGMAKYSVVLDYANQQGFLNVANTDHTRNASFVKYGLRTNLDMKLNKVLTVSVDVGGRLEDRFSPNYSIYSLANDVVNYPSNIYPVYDEQSTDPICKFSGTATHPNNPVGSLTGTGWTTSRTKLLQANFKFREDLGSLVKGLYLQEGFSFYSRTIGNTAKTSTYARYFNGVAQTSDVSSYIRSDGYWSSGKERWMQGNVTAGYDGVFGKNAVNANLTAYISDYNGSGSNFYDWKYRYVNFSGRLAYTYDNRYNAGLGFSYFGSDAYAPGRRFIFYPTLSLGWTVSNEAFLKDNKTVNFLKIRASAGYSGATEANVDIYGFQTGGRYLYQQYYSYTEGFITGLGPGFGGGESGIRPLFNANPDVTAEKSLKINGGVDLKLFNKLTVKADYFLDKRSGILTLDNYLLDYNGYNDYYSNIGAMTNQGVDASFIFADKVGEFNYSVYGNVLYAVNRVDEMGEVSPKYKYNSLTGQPYGTRMGLECIGFYDVKDFDLDGELNMGLPVPQFGAVQPGDLRYKDQDGDGLIDETDIVKIGNPAYPTTTVSIGADFSFRGFDLSLLITGNMGGTVNLMDYSAWKPFENYGNAFEWAKGAWVYYPEAKLDNRANATFPRLSAQQNDNNYRSSSFWIHNNNYLRLRNVELGYDFATLSAVRKAKISKLRVFLTAYNMFTLSSVLREFNMDPETADYGYPAAKSCNLGVQISF